MLSIPVASLEKNTLWPSDDVSQIPRQVARTLRTSFPLRKVHAGLRVSAFPINRRQHFSLFDSRRTARLGSPRDTPRARYNTGGPLLLRWLLLPGISLALR